MFDGELSAIAAQIDLRRYRRDLRECLAVERRLDLFVKLKTDEDTINHLIKTVKILKLRLDDSVEIVSGYFDLDETPTCFLDKKLTFFLDDLSRLTEDNFIKAVADHGCIYKKDFK